MHCINESGIDVRLVVDTSYAELLKDVYVCHPD
jgi:hypothetical protein